MEMSLINIDFPVRSVVPFARWTIRSLHSVSLLYSCFYLFYLPSLGCALSRLPPVLPLLAPQQSEWMRCVTEACAQALEQGDLALVRIITDYASVCFFGWERICMHAPPCTLGHMHGIRSSAPPHKAYAFR